MSKTGHRPDDRALCRWRSDPLGLSGTEASRTDRTPHGMRSHEESGGYGRWSPGVCLNIGANYLDRHVDAGAGERSALV